MDEQNLSRPTLEAQEPKKDGGFFNKKGLAAVLGIAGVFGAVFGTPHLNRDTIEAKVVQKEIKIYQSSGKYGKNFDYVIETDKGTLICEDSLLEMQFNAVGLYNGIEEGATYQFKTYGWEVEIFEFHPAIIDYQKIETKAAP